MVGAGRAGPSTAGRASIMVPGGALGAAPCSPATKAANQAVAEAPTRTHRQRRIPRPNDENGFTARPGPHLQMTGFAESFRLRASGFGYVAAGLQTGPCNSPRRPPSKPPRRLRMRALNATVVA